MKQMWTYDKDKRFDQKGDRWHFVRCDFYDTDVAYEDRSVEIYFRSDDRSTFGVLRFERQKDIPYRNYEVMINKIMNDVPFRESLLVPETKSIWNRNWK
jgi:hypothetical protein